MDLEGANCQVAVLPHLAQVEGSHIAHVVLKEVAAAYMAASALGRVGIHIAEELQWALQHASPYHSIAWVAASDIAGVVPHVGTWQIHCVPWVPWVPWVVWQMLPLGLWKVLCWAPCGSSCTFSFLFAMEVLPVGAALLLWPIYPGAQSLELLEKGHSLGLGLLLPGLAQVHLPSLLWVLHLPWLQVVLVQMYW